ncbi:MAG TPA: MauE/DoxX family redox-associated membrane protein [Candidatus Omnitrophota bacterium]|nr:MauE/DoxX family redox-associated membrane protein [Candidatus Omnitrophota bacterium]
MSMKVSCHIHVVARVLIGGFFVVVAAEKLLAPYENFFYVIQGYDILPPFLARFAAMIVPWVEFFLGVFLVLGLWLKPVLRLSLLMISAFIIMLTQAVLRKLPMQDCGCYGELLSLPLHVSILLDMGLFLAVGGLLKYFSKTSCMSLDRYFEAKNL